MEENMETKELLDAELDSAWDGEGTPEPETQSADAPEDAEDQAASADQQEMFTLKNRDETRQVGREELIAMAQKGWDYDNVRRERDQLRQYRQAMEQVRATIGENRAHSGAPGAEGLIRRVKANAQRQDMERFLQAYPGVKAESIPQEVWGRVARGVPLVSAYAMHENQQLRVQLRARQQDQINRARTPGGLSANAGAELDELDRYWNEEE